MAVHSLGICTNFSNEIERAIIIIKKGTSFKAALFVHSTPFTNLTLLRPMLIPTAEVDREWVLFTVWLLWRLKNLEPNCWDY